MLLNVLKIYKSWLLLLVLHIFIDFRSYDIPEKNEGKPDMVIVLGNSVSDRFGWSSSIEEVTSVAGVITSGPSGKETSRQEIPQLQSYRSLVESYNLVSGGYSKTPELKDFIQQFESNLMSDAPEVATQVDNEQVICRTLHNKINCYSTERMCMKEEERI